MSETSFPVNDLLRRKMQTGLAILSLALCVASTLYLILLTERIGINISSSSQGKLTAGFSMIFSPFLTMLLVLIIIMGIIMITFTAFLMSSQRTRDLGLIKASGCPNDILFGYFFTELLIIAFAGCLLGTVLGIAISIASATLLGNLNLNLFKSTMDVWTCVGVFFGFFALATLLSVLPILRGTRGEAAKALSPRNYLGLEKAAGFSVLSKSNLSVKLAVRAFVRHKSATIRIVLCLSTIFLLITVAIAGGLIARNTSENWIQKAIGTNVLLIAHQDMINQYEILMSDFYEGSTMTHFNYTDPQYQLPNSTLKQLNTIEGIATLDARLVLQGNVEEVQGIIYGSSTSQTRIVGDSRNGESLIIGVDPATLASSPFLRGEYLQGNQTAQAVIGDTVAQDLFSSPMDQRIRILGDELKITGVCIDPLNNGNVIYVPIGTLEGIVSNSSPNLLLVKLNPSTNATKTLEEINSALQPNTNGIRALSLKGFLDKSMDFVDSLWSTITLIPLISLLMGATTLIGYLSLAINEQKQEFGILRAIGIKPGSVLNIILTQSMIIILASYAIGLAFGTILTLLILVQEPVVSTLTIIEIAGWLLVALTITFASSIYPARTFSKKPLLETMSEP
jgi:ABC-type antimicrobial peptide transport system permease subunit